MKKILIILLFPLFSLSQTNENYGSFFYNNFSPDIYNAGTQNWDVCQTNEGIILVANNYGILTYDGFNWNLIKTTKNVRCIEKDSSGRIFVGLRDDFGFLYNDEIGNLKFCSLKQTLPNSEEIIDIWTIHFFQNNVFFQGYNKIYQYNDNGLVKIHSSKENLFLTYKINNQLFTTNKKGHFFKFINNQFVYQKINTKTNRKNYTYLPFENNKIVCTSVNDGIFLMQPSKNKDFDWEVDDAFFKKSTQELIKNSFIYCGIKISNNIYAYGSTKKGLIILDSLGNTVYQFNKNNGAIDNNIWNLFLDNQKGLWMSCNKGISRIEIGTPIKYWAENTNFDGVVYKIIKHNHKIYFSTSIGLWCIDNNKFNRIGDFAVQIFDLDEFETNDKNKTKSLLISTNHGIYELKNNKINLIKKAYSILNLLVLKNTKNTVAYCSIDGISILKNMNGSWIDEGIISDFNSEIIDIHEDKRGNIWTQKKELGLFCFLKDESNTFKNYKYYDSIEGKPFPKQLLSINKVNDTLIFFVNNKSYFIDEDNKNIFQENTFFPYINSPLIDVCNSKINDTNYYILNSFDEKVSKTLNLIKILPNQKIQIDSFSFNRFKNYNFYTFFMDSCMLWMGGAKGLFVFDYSKKDFILQNNYNQCVITKITNSNDSLISNIFNKKDNIKIPYYENSIIFNFSNLSFDNSENNLYSYILEGYDKNWSSWVKYNKKEYTNLKDGIYIFKVKSKNTYGIESNEAIFFFKVLPPWYRSIWAYISYLFLFITLLYILGKLLVYRMKRKNKLLEKIIKERTHEIILRKDEIERKNTELAQQKEEIRAQRDELDNANKDLELKVLERTRQLELKNKEIIRKQDELQFAYNQLKVIEKIKSDFLTSISHELKTPLTSIIGFGNLTQKSFERIVEDVWDKIEDVKLRKSITRMGENIDIVVKESTNLSDIINDILTMSRIKAGFMEWNNNNYTVKNLLEEVVKNTNEYFLDNKYLNFITEYNDNLGVLYIDKDKFLQLLNNVISNSIKFTQNGDIKLKAYTNYNSLCIEVEDSGVGIPKDQLNTIFESFTQVGDTLTNKPKGIGLGLSICKEIVNHYNGKITINSHLGKGSICKIILPLV